MITAANVLILTVGLIGIVWAWILHDIGKIEFLYPSEQRRWANRRILMFMILVVGLWGRNKRQGD